MSYEKIIQEAEGYVSLGMHLDAWETLETLPAEQRLSLSVLAIRLEVCTGLEKWEMGQTIAGVIESFHPSHVREAAGRFYLAHAASLCRLSLLDQAKMTITKLSLVWPEGKLEVLDCKHFEPIW